MKLSWKDVAELGACCAVTVIGTYAIPSHYEIRQAYRSSGSVKNPDDLPVDAALAIQRVLDLPFAADLARMSCKPLPREEGISCEVRTNRNGPAQKIADELSSRVPDTIGHLSKEQLDRRVRETDAQILDWGNQLSAFESEYEKLQGSRRADESLLAAEKITHERLEKDFQNRNQQLSLVEEGLSDPDNKEQSTFEKKKEEILKLIDGLRARLSQSEERLSTLQEPITRRETLEEALPRLRAQIDLGRVRMAALAAVQRENPKSKTFPDPDTFQLTASESAKVKTMRSWSHLPWSFAIGVLLYALLRRRRFDPALKERFRSPGEVQERFGLRYLGRLGRPQR